MIQLNLLPDVKLEFIAAQRSRRLVISVALIVSLAAVGILVLMFSASALQKKHIADLTKDITKQTATLQQKPQINKILTVQNQLNSLTALHTGKPAADRLISYLNNVTPTQVSISNFSIDFAQQTMIITGTSDGLANVNKYVDTLKNTTYITEANTTGTPAFSNIVLTGFGVNTTGDDKSQAANYTINLSFDKTIFDNAQKINLSVPQRITTRADQAQSDDLFKAPAAPATQPVKGTQ